MASNIDESAQLRSASSFYKQRTTDAIFHDKRSQEQQERATIRRLYVNALKRDHRDLMWQQRRYHSTLSKLLKVTKHQRIETNQQEKLKRLRGDRNVLRAKIWVAQDVVYQRQDNYRLKHIKCFLKCFDDLTKTVETLKRNVTNVRRGIDRVSKEIYELSRKISPDAQSRSASSQKLHILENLLETNISRECRISAKNAELREQVTKELRYRAYFQSEYSRIVQTLNSDKKYMMELIDYAMREFDNCIEIYGKVDKLKKRSTIDTELRKVELQSLMRQHETTYDQLDFYCKLNKIRPLQDLPAAIYNRRDEIKKCYIKRIYLYNNVITKIIEYTRSRDVQSVINRIQENEYVYYSYFNFSNEISYHMTILENSCKRIQEHVTAARNFSNNRKNDQMETIKNLVEIFRQNEAKLKEMEKVRKKKDDELKTLLVEYEFLFDLVEGDAKPMIGLLGDNYNMNLHNLRRYLKVLEVRIYAIMATVYIIEHNDEKKGWMDYLVKQIDRVCEWPTQLEDIVLAQQCPECAAADASELQGEETVPYSIPETRQKLYEKIAQPEMQYRLHDIIECRMPRSRYLASRSYS